MLKYGLLLSKEKNAKEYQAKLQECVKEMKFAEYRKNVLDKVKQLEAYHDKWGHWPQSARQRDL